MDYSNEINALRRETATASADIANLKGWQKTQNGSIQRLDAKVDGMYKLLLGTALTAVLTLGSSVITLLYK